MHTFSTSGIRGKYSDCTVQEISYQRNGVSGAGFHVRFAYAPTEHEGPQMARQLVATVFEADKHVAVINPLDLEDHWRGDSFEIGLRAAIKEWNNR